MRGFLMVKHNRFGQKYATKKLNIYKMIKKLKCN